MIIPEVWKTRLRVHMRIPVLGVQNSGFALGFRFSNIIGLFEYRCNNLQPWEIAGLVGLPTASNMFSGTDIQPGDTLTVTITPSVAPTTPIVTLYTVTPQDMQGQNPYGQVDPFYTAATNAANAVTANCGGRFTATSQPSVTWPQTTPGVGQSPWQMAYQAQNADDLFALAVAYTGGIYAVVTSQGVRPWPRNTFAEDGVTVSGYIETCNYLESAIMRTSDLIKFPKADVVNIRQDEMEARASLYDYWCERIAEVLGIPLYPLGASSNFGGRNTGLEV